MRNIKECMLKLAKASAEIALKRDANNTTCLALYQPKVPANLKNFKGVKK